MATEDGQVSAPPRPTLKAQGKAAALEFGVGLGAQAGVSLIYAIREALEERRWTKRKKALAIERLEAILMSAHRVSFPQAGPPRWTAPPAVTAAQRRVIYEEYRADFYRGLTRTQFIMRWRARRAAKQMVSEEVAIENEALAERHRRHYEFCVRTWPGLLANEPQAVIETLEEAFADNPAPALPVDCEGSRASIVVVFGGPDDVPAETCKRDDHGEPKLARRENSDRTRLFVDSAASNILATLSEAFAVTVGIHEIDCMAVIRKDRWIRRARVTPFFLASVSRSQLAGADMTEDPLRTLWELGGRFHVEDRAEGFNAIGVDDASAARQMLDAVSDVLRVTDRASEDTVA
jgi:hypothetical protein